MPIAPRSLQRLRFSLILGLVVAVVMIAVGIVTIGVDDPEWFAMMTLFAGAVIAGVTIIRLVLLRHT